MVPGKRSDETPSGYLKVMISNCYLEGVVGSSPAEIPWKEHQPKYTQHTGLGHTYGVGVPEQLTLPNLCLAPEHFVWMRTRYGKTHPFSPCEMFDLSYSQDSG